MLKTAFGKQAMGRSQTFQWFSQFKAGRTLIDDEERSGWPVSSSTPEIIEWEHQINCKDRRCTTDEVSMLLGISHRTCHKILTEDLKMRRVTSKFVPRLLIVDNAPAHAALMTQQVLTANNMTVVPHSPYSPDLAPCEFFLFPKLKMKLKGQRFQTVEVIQAESQAVLSTLCENDFQECFKKCQRRWDRCRGPEGDYCEGHAGP